MGIKKTWVTRQSERSELFALSIRADKNGIGVTELELPPMNPNENARINYETAKQRGLLEKQVVLGVFNVDDLRALRYAIDQAIKSSNAERETLGGWKHPNKKAAEWNDDHMKLTLHYVTEEGGGWSLKRALAMAGINSGLRASLPFKDHPIYIEAKKIHDNRLKESREAKKAGRKESFVFPARVGGKSENSKDQQRSGPRKPKA